MEKIFKTIDEQIKILESRNLVIKNHDTAKKIFRENNYYYLINGYKDIFIDDTNSEEKFKNNVTLDEIFFLYKFDIEIRVLFFKYVLSIERRLDTYIAYEFSKIYGHINYLQENNFNNTKRNSLKIKKLIYSVESNIMEQLKNGNKMLNHYMHQYGYIPLWVLIRLLTFGQVSKFYSLMHQKDQNLIAKNFNVKEKELKIYISNLAIIRNICAHDEKLFDIRLKKAISNNYIHKYFGLKLEDKIYCNGFKDLFSIVIIFKELLTENEFKDFYLILLKLIDDLCKNIVSVDFNVILNTMGFPKNYNDLLNI